MNCMNNHKVMILGSLSGKLSHRSSLDLNIREMTGEEEAERHQMTSLAAVPFRLSVHDCSFRGLLFASKWYQLFFLIKS